MDINNMFSPPPGQLFLACLEAIQSEHILTDVDQHKLFSNIREICETNIRFWTLFLYPMVRHSQATGQPMCVDHAQPAFMSFDQLFAPYEKYCAEQSTCQFYCKELHGNNTLFQAYLAWCEGQKLCNRWVEWQWPADWLSSGKLMSMSTL